jgi:GntR family transcriptional regulator
MYLVLRERIRAHACAPGEPLPGEHQLAQQFGVSRVTVRRTLHQLELEGLVVRRRGVGTFPVVRPLKLQDRYNIGGLRDAAPGDEARIATLAAGPAPAPPDVAALFGNPTAPLLRIERQRSVGEGAPFTLLTTWVHPRHADKLSRRQLRSAQILRVLEAAQVEMVRAEQVVSARAADEHAARRLDVPVGSPLIVMTTLFSDRQDTAVAYLEALYRPDRYEYRLTMLRAGGGERWRQAD